MGLGYRTFIVSGDEILASLSQKAFHEFSTLGKPALRAYAGKTVDIAFAYYEIENRRPHRVFRMEVSRFKVLRSGAMDRKHQWKGLALAADSLGALDSASRKHESAGNVVDAAAAFNRRRRKARHSPDLSPKVARKIAALLGL